MRIHVLHNVAYNFAEKRNHSFQSSALISGFTPFFYHCFHLCSLLSYNPPGRHVEAQDVLNFRNHVLVQLMGKVSDGQKQILDLHVRRVAAEDDVGRSSSYVFLVDSTALVVNSVHCLFHLK